MASKVAKWKMEEVKELEKLMQEYPIIGLVNMQGLPGAQLEKLRIQMRKNMVLRMTKKTFIHIAANAVKEKVKGIHELDKRVVGMPALIFTKEDPFKLYKAIQKNKSSAPAKPGQLSPREIIIPKGPTPFTPGPMIGELGQLGIKAGVEGGKIAVKQDFVAARQGEPIKDKIAGLLQKLGIEPMEIGLNVVAMFEKGKVFAADIMFIGEDRIQEDLTKAARWAMNLSVEASFPTKENIEMMLAKAHNEARALDSEVKINGGK